MMPPFYRPLIVLTAVFAVLNFLYGSPAVAWFDVAAVAFGVITCAVLG